jgi:NDP-sugar pyrophosphorylase family protein
MKAVLLVGGEGTRLRPLTYTTPKALVPIGNVPFIERQIAWLAGHGVDEVVLSMGYLPEPFQEHFPDNRFGDVTLRYAIEETPLGTAGGIRFAADGIDERFVVCNGDVLTTLDVSAMVRFHVERAAEASIYLCEVDDPSAFGVVPTRDDGEVVGFIEKPPRDQAPTNWINAGVYVLEPTVLQRIPPRINVSIERETFPRMVEHRNVLYGFHWPGYWLDIGTPQQYLQANLDVLAGRLPGADAAIDPSARISGEVENSVIGAGAWVAAGARVERSVLLAGSRVEAGARVLDSVLGVDAALKEGASAVDVTFVGNGVEVPAQTRVVAGRLAPAGFEDSPARPDSAARPGAVNGSGT